MNDTSTLILGIALMIIMWGMGLSLVINDFKRILTYPKAIFVGLVNQFILLPLIGYGLVVLFSVPPAIAIGIMILAACPGGATSNLIAHLAKGDTALSVSLTAVSSLLSVITIPFVVNFALESFANQNQVIQLDVVDTIQKTVTIIIIPIIIGMFIRKFFPKFAQKMGKPVRIASAVILFVIIIGIVNKEKDNIVEWFTQAGVIALTLNVLTMFVGFYSAKLLRLSKKQAISISIESGVQNGTMALVIAGALLKNTSYAVAPAIYSLIMFFTGGLIIFYGIRKLKSSTS